MTTLKYGDTLVTPASAKELRAAWLKLTLIAGATQLIYTIYIIAFPLISNTHKGGPAADLEILMRDYRWFAPVYTIGIFLLYFLFWQALKTVSSVKSPSQRDAKRARKAQVSDTNATRNTQALTRFKLFILSFGLIFGFTLVWLYPITANDLFRYVLRGRVWAVYGESPMLSPPNNFPTDPYSAFAGEFGQWVSGYGPLWEILVQIPMGLLGAVDMVPGSISLKLIVLLAYALCAIILGWFALPEITPKFTFASIPQPSYLPTLQPSSLPTLQPSNPPTLQPSASLIALTFFAWNPLILIQAAGNGHNDMVFMALMVLGIAFWQRKWWAAAILALTLATLAKITGLLILPFFAIVVWRDEPSWRQRLFKMAGIAVIALITSYIVYSALGPLPQLFQDVWNALSTRLSVVFKTLPQARPWWDSLSAWLGFAPFDPTAPPGLGSMLTVRRGFAIASGLRMLLREILPGNAVEPIPRNTASYIFIIFYLWIVIALWRRKLTFITASFLAFFSQLMLGATFRIWYPMWLIPLVALHLTPLTFWSTFLFSLTSELSIINYFVVWRWWLNTWSWGKNGPLAKYWNYWTTMHLLTVPWVFGIPLFGPILLRWWQRRPTFKKRGF
ncbi:MAG: PT domain-containing protein [Anaerolineae bacterium]